LERNLSLAAFKVPLVVSVLAVEQDHSHMVHLPPFQLFAAKGVELGEDALEVCCFGYHLVFVVAIFELVLAVHVGVAVNKEQDKSL
jgi:hypothetical protein